jgi:hypothetical protein
MDKKLEELMEMRFGVDQFRAEAEQLLGISKDLSKATVSATEAEN